MHRPPKPLAAVSLLAAAMAAHAQTGPQPVIHIAQPAAGAELQARDPNVLNYAITGAGHGDYVHISIDGVEVSVMHSLEGSYRMETLAPGHHRICVTVVGPAHRPVGTRKCIAVDVR